MFPTRRNHHIAPLTNYSFVSHQLVPSEILKISSVFFLSFTFYFCAVRINAVLNLRERFLFMMKSPGVAICSYGNIQEGLSRFFFYTELGRSKLNFAILYVVKTFRHHLYRGDVFFKVIFHDLFIYPWFKRSDFKTFFPLYSIPGQNECWRSLHLLFRTHRCYFCQVFFNER